MSVNLSLFESPVRTRYSPPEPPDVCRQRHLGNDESEAANRRVDPHKERLRELVFEAVAAAGDHGATSAEIVEATGIVLQTVSGRLAELKKARRLLETDRRRPTPSGASARVLVAAR